MPKKPLKQFSKYNVSTYKTGRQLIQSYIASDIYSVDYTIHHISDISY